MKPRPPLDLQIPFDRVTYRDGQLLTACDLQDDLVSDRRLRRLHTRYLHATWGIALGFAVNGNTGDDTVKIGPGYAIDISGREILSSIDLGLSVPKTSASTNLMLVVAYQEDAAYRALPRLDVCFPGKFNPHDERPLVGWRTVDTFQAGADVPLAKVTVSNGALIAPPDLNIRRNASRLVRPHIGFGKADVAARDSTIPGYFKLPIDTSDAGFSRTPQYFAKLEVRSPGLPANQIATASEFGFISEPARTDFNFNVPLVFTGSGLRPTVTVSWLGVQPVTGCAPIPNLLLILAGFFPAPLLLLETTA